MATKRKKTEVQTEDQKIAANIFKIILPNVYGTFWLMNVCRGYKDYYKVLVPLDKIYRIILKSVIKARKQK